MLKTIILLLIIGAFSVISGSTALTALARSFLSLSKDAFSCGVISSNLADIGLSVVILGLKFLPYIAKQLKILH